MCQGFATSLLDHARSSYELEVMLNYAAEVRACAVQYSTVHYSIVHYTVQYSTVQYSVYR